MAHPTTQDTSPCLVLQDAQRLLSTCAAGFPSVLGRNIRTKRSGEAGRAKYLEPEDMLFAGLSSQAGLMFDFPLPRYPP